MKPNIFDYATSELSQDAFLAWLFKWAEKENEALNKPLHDCAEEWLRLFLGNINPREIKTVKVDKQWQKIDLWITVNDTYHLIIEDKTNTGPHDNQLKKYKKTAKDWYKLEGGQVTDFDKYFSFVYYKTGYISLYEKNTAEEAGYRVIGKTNFLNIFNCSNLDNPLISDYIQMLEKKFKDQELVYTTPYNEIINDKEKWIKPFYESLKSDLNPWMRKSPYYMTWYWCETEKGQFSFQLNDFELFIGFYKKNQPKDIIREAEEKINNAIKKNRSFKKCLGLMS